MLQEAGRWRPAESIGRNNAADPDIEERKSYTRSRKEASYVCKWRGTWKSTQRHSVDEDIGLRRTSTEAIKVRRYRNSLRRSRFTHSFHYDSQAPDVYADRSRSKNKCSGKKKDKRKKSSIQDLGERAERFEFLNGLARAPAEITFGQVANGDIDSIIKQLLSIGAKRRSKSAVDIASEKQKDVLPPNRHQVVQLTVYSESVFALLGSGATSNVISDGLANKLKSSLTSTERRIIIADGSTGGCKWIGTDIPVGFGKMVIRLKFMVIASVSYD